MGSVEAAPTHVTLNSGHNMPVIGLGTWKAAPGVVGAAVESAVRIGDALQKLFKGVVKRNDHHGTEEAPKCLETTLKKLQLEYLDLYLIHWPVNLRKGYTWPLQPHMFDISKPIKEDIKETWQAMEKMVEEGKVRAIGVSNFSAKKVEDILEYAKMVPAVNQVECHPMWRQDKLRASMKSHNIHLSAYSPLGSWGTNGVEVNLLEHPGLKGIGEKLGKSPAQVALRWGVQMGNSVQPKSTKTQRLKENSDIFNFSLSREDMAELEKLEQVRFVSGSAWIADSGSYYKMVEDIWDGEGL